MMGRQIFLSPPKPKFDLHFVEVSSSSVECLSATFGDI